jgi:hypothetical protein
MKRTIFILLVSLLIWGCKKPADDTNENQNNALEPYMRGLLEPDTLIVYKGSYYIHAEFKNLETLENKQLTYSADNQTISAWYSPIEAGLGMSYQGAYLSDSLTHQALEISFFFNTETDTAFKIEYASYIYSDPWRNVAGANVMYYTPVEISDPETYYLFVGSNSSKCYFNITYISKDRVNGIFHTKWDEITGGQSSYDVYGDFSIPNIKQ